MSRTSNKPKTPAMMMASDEAKARSAAYRALRDATPSLPRDAEGSYTDAAATAHKTAANVARKATGDVAKALKARMPRAQWTPVHEDKARAVLLRAGIDAYMKALSSQGYVVPETARAGAEQVAAARYAENVTLRKMGAGGVPATVIESVFV